MMDADALVTGGQALASWPPPAWSPAGVPGTRLIGAWRMLAGLVAEPGLDAAGIRARLRERFDPEVPEDEESDRYWAPHDRQLELLRCEHGEVLYGGAVGGGKSDALLADAILHCLRHGRHARALLLRLNATEMRTLRRRAVVLCSQAGGRWSAQEETWSFPGGGLLQFGHLVRGVDTYWGQEYTWIGIDEITRAGLDESDYRHLATRLRSPAGVPCVMRCASNPGGAHHSWVQARWVRLGERVPSEGDTRTRYYLPARLTDNPTLARTGYGAELAQLPEAERAAYLDGDWDAFEGAVFRLVPGVHVWTWAEFNERYGLPANNRKPPEGWRRYRAYDYGMAAPSACYWIALDLAPPAGTGRAIAYREDYTVAPDGKGGVKPNKGLNLPPRDAAKRLARMSEGESYAGSWAGRDLFDDPRADTGGGAALATHFQAEGVRFVAWKVGPGSRLAGKVALQQWLAPRADGAAGLVFIGEECPHALRTLPALEYAKNDPEQVDDSGEDHAFDALAGWAKMAPRPAVAPPPSGPKWLEAEMPGAGARIS